MNTLARPLPPRSRDRATPLKSLVVLLSCLGIANWFTYVEAAASEALLGGQYVPTTDVGFIEDLTLLIEGIATSNSTVGETLYAKYTPNSDFSLKSIGSSDSSTILNAATNPLYAIYMYGYYKSPNGSGKDGAKDRANMLFLDEAVDYYGHTIITNEFEKPSGYNAALNAETIRVTNMWMATIQSLYDAQALCDAGPNGYDALNDVNPVDKAAAFYFGTHEDDSSSEGGSLFAWVARTRELFVSEAGFLVNDAMVYGLDTVQTILDDCLALTGSDNREKEYELTKMVNDLTQKMTIPLVQNLIYWANEVAKSDEKDKETEDFMILYALATLPPIMVCDKDTFNSLYERLISNPSQMDTTVLSEVLTTLFNSFTCLGITCEEVGLPEYIIAPMSITMPACEDTPHAVNVAGYEPTYDKMLMSAIVDLDLLTIGILVEMEANDAALNVYWWNKYALSLSQNITDVSLSDMSFEAHHEQNTLAQEYNDEYNVDTLIYNVISNNEDFEWSGASSVQRREVVEILLATVVLPVYAMDQMLKAVDDCNNGQDSVEWDKAVASLVGYLEGPDEGGSEKGTLMYDIGQYLCSNANTCNDNGDAEVNRLLMNELKMGKQNLDSKECTLASENVYRLEILFQIYIIDSLAYFATQVEMDPTDTIAAANGYALATAFYPMVQRDETDETDNIIKDNIGSFISGDSNAMGSIISTLEAYITTHNGIDCKLLYNLGCAANLTSGTTTTTIPNEVFMPSTTTMFPDGDTGLYPTPNPILGGTAYPSSSTYNPTYAPSVTSKPTSSTVLSGGVMAINDGTVSSPLYSGAYKPTSNIDHIIKLIGYLDEIEKPGSKEAGLNFYKSEAEVGLSLQTLSTGSEWEYVRNINPLQVIYCYGLWISEDGDNDSNGYSNKKFDDGDIEKYGDTIVMDGFNKNSGYDEKLTAETIRVMNVWMAMVTELYKAVESCRDGSASSSGEGFNPVDHAAAFWYGSSEDKVNQPCFLPVCESEDDAGLHDWADRAASNFVEQSLGVSDEVGIALTELQSDFASCKSMSLTDADEKSNAMRNDVLRITRLMTIPLVQNFITDLATKAGKAATERDYLILYTLSLLPQLSICDEDVLKTLFNDLILENASFDGSKFSDTLKTLQDRYDCLGLTCSQVGKSSYSDSSWPACVDRGDPNIILSIAGYTPFYKASSELSRIDLDVSTVLSFIVMEANDAAWEVYKHGRNVMGSDGTSTSLRSLKLPKSPSVVEIYNKFNGDYGIDYLWITESAIQATSKFAITTPLQNSAAASIALVTMDLHIAILDNLHQSLDYCRDGTDHLVVRALWDRAIALTVGWSEGQSEYGSDTDGYLFFQMAQELCALFDTCDSNGNSETNKDLISNFSNGAVVINESNCDSLEENINSIETLLQTILLDLLAYHVKEAETDYNHYLLAHVSSYALVPFMRTVDGASADVIEQNLGTYPSNFYLTDGIETVYSALKSYVDAKGIDCGSLSSAICEGITSSDADTDSVAAPNDTGHTLAGGEYTPFTDVTKLAGLSSVLSSICTSEDASSAKSVYTDDDAAGVTLQSLSLTAGDVMSEEILFNQYVFAFFDEVDKTDGSLLFDGQPAVEYANTIVSDAIDDNIALGCLSVKVLTLWMWVVHKLNDSVEECKEGDSSRYGSIDEAAAVWIGNPLSVDDEGGLLYELAEELGVHFSHDGGEYMTTLNREIISRMSFAQATYFVNSTRCKTDAHAVTGLRKLVKEITSYMTAVLIQGFINSMLEERDAKEKEAFVELYAFAFLPHIERCGHSDLKDSLYDDLVVGTFYPVHTPSVIDAIYSQLNCLGLQCKDIGRHLLADESYPECFDHYDLVGYTPANETKTNMPARIDLDAVAIHQLMSMEKYSVAKDVYLNGHNYFDYDDEKDFGFVSLHNLTQSATIGDTDFYEYTLFRGYLSQNPGDFADELIIDALDQSGKFNETTAKQRELAVSTTIKSFVSFMSALEALNVAISKCQTASERAVTAWDGGAAFLIGSVEGTEESADAVNSTSDGRMFYSISNGLCGHFGNCIEDVGSAVGEDLIALLTKGQGEITSGQCPDATATLKSIVQLCTVSLIQSALFFADESIDDDNLAAGYVASMAVLPIVNVIDPDAAMVIKKDMRFRPSSMDGDSTAVIDAFRTVLSNPLSYIECEIISNIHRVCDAPELPTSIDTSEPSILSNGLYTATNYVTDRSSISLDIKDIEAKIKTDSLEQAVDVYTNGANSPTYNANGELSGKRSIAKLSTESSNNMKYNPIYNRFIYGLSDKSQEYFGKPVTNYADSFVRELLYARDRQQQLAAPGAMVVLNIWMQVNQKMNSAYIACKSPSSPSNPGDPSLLIDEAAAYWIGDSQDTGSSTQGHLLYALTEFVGEKYEAIPQGSQSTINTRIIDLFNQAKTHMTMTKSCSSSPTSHMKMRSILEELTPLMAVPLLRGLFYYLSIRDTVKIRLYALSVLPLFSTCSKSTFLELKSDLIDNDPVDVDKDYIFSRIKSLYDCIGLSCEMVGFMPRNNFTQCQHSSTHDELVGFSYAGDHDSIVEQSKIDVDIQDIEAFMENGLNIFPLDVEGLFGLAYSSYNKDTSSGASLINLARSTDRDVVPSFASFRRYFKDDSNYADTIINNAFQRQGVFTTASIDERRKVISFTTRYMVTYMGILEKLYTTVDLCRDSSSKTEAHESLDAAAAYFIGFAEGEDDGGTYDGVLLYGLAKRMCVLFDTCSSTNNNAESNEKIISLLYAAQGELDVGACDSLAKTIKGIENALVIPLIQATLFASRENELYVRKKDKFAPDLFSEGYVLSLSILPLINNVDTSAASDIAKVMVNGFPDDKKADHIKVFRALQVAIPKMKDLDCDMVGTLDGVSFCEGAADVRSSGVRPGDLYYLFGGLVLSLLFCC